MPNELWAEAAKIGIVGQKCRSDMWLEQDRSHLLSRCTWNLICAPCAIAFGMDSQLAEADGTWSISVRVVDPPLIHKPSPAPHLQASALAWLPLLKEVRVFC